MHRDMLSTPTAMILQRRETISLSSPFLSEDGKHYLNVILKHILPMALWRTWYTAVDSLHALDTLCDIDTAELAHQATVSQVKIERDLHELEARGLMDRYRQRHSWPQADGTIKYGTVVVKDFSRLYDLASEYHTWYHSEEYIPPERDFADFIKADRQLYHKLMRFDNYRRMLCRKKPGLQPQPRREPSSDDGGPWV